MLSPIEMIQNSPEQVTLEDRAKSLRFAVAGAFNSEQPEINRHGYLTFVNDMIHQSCVSAGWWSDLITGVPINRNFGELSALIMSEMMEAITSDPEDLDDKLTDELAFPTELADTFIRLADLGGHGTPEGQDLWAKGFLNTDDVMGPGPLYQSWLDGFELGRKGRPEWSSVYGQLQFQVGSLCEAVYPGAFPALVAKKWLYNQTRADHQLANRQAEGGKKI